ncbi:MAG: metallophosphoesterase [Candidatus Thorarchaeota archaeon]
MVVQTESQTALLLSDLHLGFEHELYEKKGVAFPAQHTSIFNRVASLVENHSINEIYVIGDVKHTIATDSRFNWQSIPDFMTAISQLCPTYVIPGNHDGNLLPLLPRNVTVTDVRGVLVGEYDDAVGIIHGHAWPSPEVLMANMLVVGHNHPTLRNVRVVDAPEIDRADKRKFAGVIPVAIRSKLDKNCVRQAIGVLEIPDNPEGVIVTLPSFNELFSGVQVNTPKTDFLGPIFENHCADLQSSEVFSITGVYLGTVESLRSRFNEIIK